MELSLNSRISLEQFQNPVHGPARLTILPGFRHLEKYLKPFFILIALVQSKFSSHLNIIVGSYAFCSQTAIWTIKMQPGIV